MDEDRVIHQLKAELDQALEAGQISLEEYIEIWLEEYIEEIYY